MPLFLLNAANPTRPEAFINNQNVRLAENGLFVKQHVAGDDPNLRLVTLRRHLTLVAALGEELAPRFPVLGAACLADVSVTPQSQLDRRQVQTHRPARIEIRIVGIAAAKDPSVNTAIEKLLPDLGAELVPWHCIDHRANLSGMDVRGKLLDHDPGLADAGGDTRCFDDGRPWCRLFGDGHWDSVLICKKTGKHVVEPVACRLGGRNTLRRIRS